MPGGRPTKCTPELTAEFANLMAAGNYLETACDFLGIHKTTVYRWLNRAEAALEATRADAEDDIHEDQVPEDERVFVDFRNATLAAAARAEVRNLALIQQASRDRRVEKARVEGRAVLDAETGEPVVLGDWRAAAWWLEKRKQDTWGERKTKLEHTGAGGGPVQVEHGLDPARVAESLRGLAARAAGGADPGTEPLAEMAADD